MAASLGRLTLDLVTHISSFTEPLERAERQAKKSTEAISSSFDQAGASIKNMAASVATVAASYVSLEKIIEVQRNFDKLNASLITSTGSAKNAAVAFSALQQFAQTTPYGLEQSVEAFTKLVNLGLNPSARALNSYGNTASAMGKDLNQMVEAVADATTGEFERLKEFGIKASQNGGKIAFTFQGTTKVVENSSKAIEEYLTRIGEVNFAGSMSNRMKTLDGSIANLQDTFESFLLKVSQSGIGEGVKTGVDAASGALTKLSDNLETAKEVTIVFGAYMVGAAIPATKKYVTGVYDKIAALIAERQQILLNTEIEAVRAARTAHLTGIELANAEAQLVRLSGMQRLAFVESTLIPLQTAHAAALEADTAAQAANNAAKLTAANVGRGLLGILGGPVGLGLTVATVAASYFLLKDSTKDVPQVLDTQGQSVDDLRQKYEKLSAVQKDTAIHELTKQVESLRVKYVTASSDLSAYIGYIEDSGRVSEKVAQQIQQQYQKYLEGKLTADQFYTSVKSINGVSDEQVTKIRNLVSTNDAAKTSYTEQSGLLGDLTKKSNENSGALDGQKKSADDLSKSTDALSQFQKKQNYTLTEQARVLGLTAENWGKLTKAQQDYAAKVATDVGRQEYITKNMKGGRTREEAEFMANQRESMGIPFNAKLNYSQQMIAHKAWEVSGNYTLSKSELTAFAKVQQNAAKYNFSDKESLYGLPSGLLSAIMMNESRGDTYRNGKLLTSESGAQGSFQFLPKTAKRFGVDVTSVESSAAGAAKYLQYLYKRFGDWDSAIAAYHAGEGNVEKGTNIGPRTRNYVLNANKYVAAANGKSTVDTSLTAPSQAEMLAQQAAVADAQKAIDDKRKEIDAQYYTETEKLEKEHKDRVKSINQAYAGTKELKTRLSQEDALYKEQTVQLQVNREKELNQLKAFETDRITQIRQSYDQEIRLMKVSTKYFGADREEQIKLLERAKQSEIDAVKREEEQQVISAFEAYMNETEIVLKRYAIERDEIKKNYQLAKETREKLLQANSMKIFSAENSASNSVFQYGQNATQALYQRNDPNGFARINLQDQYSTEIGGLNQAYANHNASIENNPLLDQQQRQQKLLAAHEQYLQAKQALNQKYADDEKNLLSEQQNAQLNTISSMLSTVSTTWSGFTEIIKKAQGENSGVYQAMFMVQQGMAAAQAIIYGNVASAAALAPPPIGLGPVVGAPLSALMKANGYASAALIAAQTVAAGFATGGYTGSGGKNDVAGIVHKGEVVWSQEDVARSGGVGAVERARRGGISGYADGGIVGGMDASTSQSRIASALTDPSSKGKSQPIVNVHTLPGTTATATANDDGSLNIRIQQVAEQVVIGQLRNPNSRISKSVGANTTASRRR